MPYDVGGSGDCFFRSVSHQLYGTPELHFEIRMAGINHLNNHPEIYIESFSDNSWEDYIQQMSTPGTWWDNIIIQAVANAHNCIVYITESDVNKPDGTLITPILHEGRPNTIFIGYINELHYVSTIPLQNSQNKNRLTYLKGKLLQSDNQKEERLAKRRKTRHAETDEEREIRLLNIRQNVAKRRATKTDDNSRNQSSEQSNTNHENYLTPLMVQKHVLRNIDLFHKSNEYLIKQCTVCMEAWPSVQKRQSHTASDYKCSRCTRDKNHSKKFSKENNIIPSAVPCQLQGLTQVEEMLIARALPIMRVYVKPGGQKGYSGHCINLPQHIEELACSLPRYPEDLSVIVVRMKGKENSFKDITVRKKNVAEALDWLINNNPHYKGVKVNQHSLNCLPEHGVPHDLALVEREDTDNETSEPDFGFQNTEDTVYNEQTEIHSFLPIPQCEQQEIQAIQQKLSSTHSTQAMSWPTVDNEPINEYTTPFLATMAFPTLFPDGKGDPTNPSLYRDIPLGEKIKHLLKYAERKDDRWIYRFASHPRFAYWAFNMIERKRILQQTAIFFKQNPGEAHLTTEELQHMIANNSSHVFLSKISRYLANLTGSNAYWFKAKEDLKAIIHHVGPPTFFFTFSSADMHWPELHALFTSGSNKTSENKRYNVINNSHITDWFFTQRLKNFIKH